MTTKTMTDVDQKSSIPSDANCKVSLVNGRREAIHAPTGPSSVAINKNVLETSQQTQNIPRTFDFGFTLVISYTNMYMLFCERFCQIFMGKCLNNMVIKHFANIALICAKDIALNNVIQMLLSNISMQMFEQRGDKTFCEHCTNMF